ncbi:MAG: AMP-binding protein [Candidatus Nanopelagicales bacterium]|nr:AMP-binding protein [Candidatus Nanopelagicales bacterium]MDZ4250511.1 AMP-binding protein [Candidatus Nanopelagicales bacterium]
MHVATARELQADAVRAAAGLWAMGARPGDRVAITTPEHPSAGGAPMALSDVARSQARVLSIVLGSLRAGIVPVMINPLLKPGERDLMLSDAQPIRHVRERADVDRLLDDPAPAPDLSDFPQGRPMHYTSGTTGTPKGVWTGDLPEAQARELWLDEQSLWQFTDQDVSLVHGPLCHSGPLRFAIAVVLAGGSIAFPGRFDARRTARALVELKPTTAFVVPSHIQRVLALPGGPPASPYRMLVHAGAPCPQKLKTRMHHWAGAERVWEFYGATEGQFSVCQGLEWEAHPGTVGRARTGRHLIISDDVVWCAAPSFARFSYWRDPESTAKAWRETGFGPAFTVGDLGRLDSDGYLFLDGRREDLIISGGVNVYPAEVEAVLGACPGVREVAVFGVADEDWGMRVCVTYTGAADQAVVAQWARDRLASYKIPKETHKLSSLPYTASGKIKRLELANRFS